MFELYVLLVLMIVGAIIAVEMKDLLSSVIAVGAVGLVLSVAFLVLKAPDLAITQLVVELLCLIILIRATIKKDIPQVISRQSFLTIFVTLVSIGIFLAFAHSALRGLPSFGHPIMRVADHYLAWGLTETGATNLVTSVILDFRAYDTLGEATVLFTAVIGVLAVMRRMGRKKPGKKIEGENG
jgi:multisubunit Na+/H+ antiporter MnhB subunit